MRLMLGSSTRGPGRLAAGLLAMALVAVGVVGLRSGSESALETRRALWADSSLREEWTVRRTTDGSFVREGTYRSWYESGRLNTEGQYRGDRKTGLWQTWYDLATPVKAAWGHYVDDQKDGVWEYQMDPECRHAMAAENGRGCCALPPVERATGRADQVERYRLGVPEGLWIAWYPGGQISDSLVYAAGKLEGRAVSYHANGRLSAVTVFRHGVRVEGTQMWDPAGNPL
jgi:hypothetical protein